MHSFLHGHVDGVLPTLIPVSSLTLAEKEGFCDSVGISLFWNIWESKWMFPQTVSQQSLLLPFQLLQYSCYTHIMLMQIRSELCFSHLYPELSFTSSPVCRAVHKWHIEAWEARNPAVALAFRRGRSTDCKLWSAFLCIRNARYRAYSINMHSRSDKQERFEERRSRERLRTTVNAT